MKTLSTGVVLQCVSSEMPHEFLPGRFYDAERMYKDGDFIGFALVQNEAQRDISPELAHLAELFSGGDNSLAIIRERTLHAELGQPVIAWKRTVATFKVIEL